MLHDLETTDDVDVALRHELAGIILDSYLRATITGLPPGVKPMTIDASGKEHQRKVATQQPPRTNVNPRFVGRGKVGM